MKKGPLAAALIAGNLVAASSAFANHGFEYPVSACDKNGDHTAHMTITSVGVYERDEAIAATVQRTFTELMQEHAAADHAAITPAYRDGLVAKFGAAMEALVEGSTRPYVYLDFHHPKGTAPSTPGCSR